MILTFQDVLKNVSESIKASVLLFNGEIRSEKDLIKDVTKQSSKRANQNSTNVEIHSHIMVDIYSPCVCTPFL